MSAPKRPGIPAVTASPASPRGNEAESAAGLSPACGTGPEADQPQARTAPLQDDHDSPWKEALEIFFPQALELLAPNLHAELDRTAAPVFLDKELQAIALPGKKGRRFVDKLAQVRLRGGVEAWLLIHVEVERRLRDRQALRLFAWRMHEYRYRIQARIMRQRGLALPPPVYSLGILLDNPGVGDHLVHTDEHHGQGVRFTFPVVELEGWRGRWDELESRAPGNPFAVLVMAQLQANRYRDKRMRLGPKFELVRSLRHYGYTPTTAGQIYRLIEWMITLPRDLEPEYLQAVNALPEEHKMTYVTLIEREGIKRGRVEGIKEGLTQGLTQGQADLLLRQIRRRFGAVDEAIDRRIRSARARDLETWSLNFVDAATLEDVFRG